MLIILRAYGLKQRLKYDIYDTKTDSLLKGNDMLEHCINNIQGVGVVTAYDDDKSKLDKYVVVSKIGERYKIVRLNNTVAKVETLVIDREELIRYINGDRIINVQFNGSRVVLKGYYEKIEEDICFKLEIDTLYSKFMAKSILIGLDMSFKYRVEGKRVILTEYTGHSNLLIVPSFITSIGYMAFYKCNTLREVELPKKLEAIGAYAFSMTEITRLVMPEEVEFICMHIFMGTKYLLDSNKKPRHDMIKLPKSIGLMMKQ